MRSLLILAALTIIGVSGCKPATSTTGSGTQTATKKTYSRDELRAMVMGKTAEEVVSMLGKPERTNDDSTGEIMMYYPKIAVDTISGKTDGAYIYLQKSAVVRVTF